MQLYATNSRSIVEIKSRTDDSFLMQVCGPTVYDGLHMGHVKTFVFFDVLARVISHSGQKVRFILNFTDIDENVFKKAEKEGLPFQRLAEKYCAKALDSLRTLNIVTPTCYPRASEYVQDSIEMIKKLIAKKMAYESNGNVFLEYGKILDHGPVSGLKYERLMDLRFDSYHEKRGTVDFLLWYKCNGKPYWQSPWGLGRPAWHIQDAIMSSKNFGGLHDLHGGAIELVFPHHDFLECLGRAIEGVSPYVSYWVHTCVLMIRGKKMSKSDGNVVYVDQILQKYSPEAIRVYFLSMNRESVVDFRIDELEKCEEAVKEIKLDLDRAKGSFSPPSNELLSLKDEFYQSVSSNMNISNALSIFFTMVRLVSKEERGFQTLTEIMNVLGLEKLLA